MGEKSLKMDGIATVIFGLFLAMFSFKVLKDGRWAFIKSKEWRPPTVSEMIYKTDVEAAESGPKIWPVNEDSNSRK